MGSHPVNNLLSDRVGDVSNPPSVLSVVNGSNADLIEHIAPLYIPDNAVVRDVTWGKGAFWAKVDTSRFTVQGSDIADHIGGHDGVIKADFTNLPDEDESADIVVLDPPYVHTPGKHMTNARYNNEATTTGMYHRDIRELYKRGMSEAWRVTKYGGQLWVKGKDEVESGVQCWSHAELREDAESLGFYARDLFILVPKSRTSMNRWNKQLHARKVHSFLWVFDKKVPKKSRTKKVAQVPTSPDPVTESNDDALENFKEFASDVLSDILVRAWKKADLGGTGGTPAAVDSVAARLTTQDPHISFNKITDEDRERFKKAVGGDARDAAPVSSGENMRSLLRDAKEKSGLTWEQVGKVLGVTSNTAWVWANNGSPSKKHVGDVVTFAGYVRELGEMLDNPSPSDIRAALMSNETYRAALDS